MALTPISKRVIQQLHHEHGSLENIAAYIDRNSGYGPRPPGAKATWRATVENDIHVGGGKNRLSGGTDELDSFHPEQQQQWVRFRAREWLSAVGVEPHHRRFAELFARLGNLAAWREGFPMDVQLCRDLRSRITTTHTHTINGDLYDFLTTTKFHPSIPYPDGTTSTGELLNTPDNAVAQLEIMHDAHPEIARTIAMELFLGHRVDYIPGNHDRHLWNDKVWLALTDIVVRELRTLRATAREIDECLERLSRKPWAMYGRTFVEHGDNDPYNRTRAPYGEQFTPTHSGQEMPVAWGDHGVRYGFEALGRSLPGLRAIVNPLFFIARAATRPGPLSHMIMAYLRGIIREDTDASPDQDLAFRQLHIRQLIQRYPSLVDDINRARPPREQLSMQQVIEGLQEAERCTPAPLYSLIEKGMSFVKSLFTLWHVFRTDPRLDRIEALQKKFGITHYVQGHSHKIAKQARITDSDERVTLMTNPSWENQKPGWSRAEPFVGLKARGVVVIEMGVGPDGKSWCETKQMYVHDASGELLEASVPEAELNVADKLLVEHFLTKRKHGVAPPPLPDTG